MRRLVMLLSMLLVVPLVVLWTIAWGVGELVAWLAPRPATADRARHERTIRANAPYLRRGKPPYA